MLNCVAAKSFVGSLLDRMAPDAHGKTPSMHKVIRDDRFSRGSVTLEMRRAGPWCMLDWFHCRVWGKKKR